MLPREIDELVMRMNDVELLMWFDLGGEIPPLRRGDLARAIDRVRHQKAPVNRWKDAAAVLFAAVMSPQTTYRLQVDGETYDTAEAAAKALGMPARTLTHKLSRGLAVPGVHVLGKTPRTYANTGWGRRAQRAKKGAWNGGDDDGDKADRPEGRDRADAGQRDPRPDLRRAG